MRWWIVIGLAVLCGAGCGGGAEEGAVVAEPAPTVPEPSAQPSFDPWFVDVTAEAGVDFLHFNGMTGEFYYSELMGGGAALFDLDRDGDLDLFVTQGHLIGPGKTDDDAVFPWRGETPPRDRLYENRLEEGSLRFVDVTEASGILGDGYSMGVATGDFDGDGWLDLYVTEWLGDNRLYRNRGDGSFEEVADAAGVTDGRWSLSAVFSDVDGDGRLDLFVTNYLDYSFAIHKECASDIGLLDYCGPASYRAVPDVLFRNRGDGTFEDATSRFGILGGAGSGMGVAVLDFNADGWLDLYVANDEMPNHLWTNLAGAGFRNDALLAGAAVNDQGKAEAGMGVDAGDADGDGWEDLIVAHLSQETNTLYLNSGRETFDDRTTRAELGMPSWDYTSFGAGFRDFDGDGWLDLLTVNGAVKADRVRQSAGEPYPLAQRNQLFRNRGDGTFEEISSRAGEVFALEEVGRGAAFGDLDNDGDTDVVVHNNAGPLRLLRNEVGHVSPWIGLRLLDVEGERDLLGSGIAVHTTSGRVLTRRSGTGGSYASAHDPRVLVGLGDGAAVARVVVTWPNGEREAWGSLEIRRYHELRRGAGERAEGPS